MEKPLDSDEDVLESGRPVYFPPGTDNYHYYRSSPSEVKRSLAKEENYLLYFNRQKKGLDYEVIQEYLVKKGNKVPDILGAVFKHAMRPLGVVGFGLEPILLHQFSNLEAEMGEVGIRMSKGVARRSFFAFAMSKDKAPWAQQFDRNLRKLVDAGLPEYFIR